MEIVIASLALILSGIALGWQAFTYTSQRRESLIVQNLTALAQLERSLADIPKAFQFHGISEDEMKAAGFEPGELAYLVSSFSIGGIYHRLVPPVEEHVFSPKSYRHTLCQSKRVRDAWPLIERMLTEVPYKRRIINTLRMIHGDSFVEKRGTLNNE